MSRLTACLCVLTALAGLAHAQQPPAELVTRIAQVTVYPEWAYVTREADAELPAGPARLVIRGLPAWVDDDSLRATVGELPGATLVAVSARTVYLARSTEAEVQAAEQASTALRDQTADLQAELQVLATEHDYLTKLQPWKLDKLSLETANRKIEAGELKEFGAYVTQGLLDNGRKRLQLERRLRELAPELDAKDKALAQLRQRTRLENKEIVLELQAAQPGKARLMVSYLISGASWFPAYTARTDSERRRVQLACEAVVQQSTGEDWTDASFTLSTIQPNASRTKPELQPWYLNATAAVAVGRLKNPSSVLFRTSRSGKLANLQELQQKQNFENLAFQEAWSKVGDNLAQAAEAVRQAEARGTTVEFSVNGRHVVRSDGLPVKLPVGEAVLEAEPRYSAVPALSQSTYVTGLMRNQAAFPFLPGPVRVFLGGSFIGQSRLGFVAENERFDLYLGLEERLKVTRTLDSRNSSTAMLSDRKRLEVAYRLTVRNLLKTPVTIEITDQIPVSQDEHVTVKLRKVSPKLPHEPEQGLLTWNVWLGAEAETDLTYQYLLEYPPTVAIPEAARMLDEQIKMSK